MTTTQTTHVADELSAAAGPGRADLIRDRASSAGSWSAPALSLFPALRYRRRYHVAASAFRDSPNPHVCGSSVSALRVTPSPPSSGSRRHDGLDGALGAVRAQGEADRPAVPHP